jgi:GAF domain-containing protein
MTASLVISSVAGAVPARPSVAGGDGDEVFRALAETAARALDMPWAAIAVADRERVTLQSSYGFMPGQTGMRGRAFPGDVAAVREPFSVTDVACDERFARGLGRLGPEFARAFAGVPIEVAGGTQFGVLCVMDREPRGVTPAQLATLTSLGGLASRQLEVHAALYEANAVRRGLSSLIEASPVAITTLDPQGLVLSWSPAAERLSGDALGHAPRRFVSAPAFPTLARGRNDHRHSHLGGSDVRRRRQRRGFRRNVGRRG